MCRILLASGYVWFSNEAGFTELLWSVQVFPHLSGEGCCRLLYELSFSAFSFCSSPPPRPSLPAQLPAPHCSGDRRTSISSRSQWASPDLNGQLPPSEAMRFFWRRQVAKESGAAGGQKQGKAPNSTGGPGCCPPRGCKVSYGHKAAKAAT